MPAIFWAYAVVEALRHEQMRLPTVISCEEEIEDQEGKEYEKYDES
jgi:hypothetical protein